MMTSQRSAALAGACVEAVGPDHVDEEEPIEDVREHELPGVVARADAAEFADRELTLGIVQRQVVLDEQALCLAERGGRLVFVRAVGERQELLDAA